VPEELPPTRFDEHWYLANNPDVGDAGMDPWDHYRHHGRFEGRSPHVLFDRAWYVAEYPDSVAGGADPFADWASRSTDEGRNPNEFFDVGWYLRKHPEVGEAGLDPVEHYRLHGWREGRRPGPLFDPTWYLGIYADVEATGLEPLTHYLNFGRHEGRHANHLEHVAATGHYRPPDGLIPWFSPVTFSVNASLADHPRLNVLVPGLGIRHMTGGPNTAIQLAYRLAALGQPVRFISTDAALDDDTAPLWAHMANISDVGQRLPNVEIIDGSNRFSSVAIGENDLFMATAWWTAQSIKAALPLVRHQRFVYLIQDFEPLFFASSSQYALALETYELDHIAVVNSSLLLDHLVTERVGRFADPDFVDRALVFEPTVDRNVFRPQVPTSANEKRRLLFYARPQNGLRNLFELGVAAIQLAVQQDVFDEAEWEFVGMGDPFDPVAVGPRSVLEPAPWKDFAGYAEQMQESDVLLSLMLAPHPSYPPLEMAACGGPAVTTVFGPKTRERLAEISPNIIGTEATIEAIAQGLADAVDRLDDTVGLFDGSALGLPPTWGEVFESVLPELSARLHALASESPSLPDASLGGPPNRYAKWLRRRIAERAAEYPVPELDGQVVFSLLTAVWNTPPEFLRALADSVLGQDLGNGWEWIIVDNGSTNPATVEVLERLQHAPNVDIQRVDSNLGILGGLRACLERARGRYVLHVDHDDLLTKDALRIVAAQLCAAEWPTAFYSDEDKVLGTQVLEPYLKPDWDPVLFSNSCYIAHLCGVDRVLALELDAYLDPATEASPDWDLFTRFANAGVTPLHIPEVLYSWRIHASSTASNPGAKPYATQTHRRVLERFIEARSDFEHFDIEVHPDSPDRLDWWVRRRHVDPRPLVSVVIGETHRVEVSALALVDHRIRTIGIGDLDELVRIVGDAAEADALVHLVNSSAQILRPQWYWEALGLFDLHDDVAVVGGTVVRSGRIHSSGDVFGFGPTGWASPAAGEPQDARGWFSHNLKQRSVDGVAADHAVFDARRLQHFLEHDRPQSVSTVGAEFCLRASELGWRVVYSPLLRADVLEPFDDAWTSQQRVEIGRRAARAASGRNRSASFSLDPSQPDRVTTRHKRTAHLDRVLPVEPEPTVTYHQWLSTELGTRGARYPLPDAPPSIAIITPAYIGTDAALFGELATSLGRQTYIFHEWIVGLDGDITDDLRTEIERASTLLGDRFRLVGGPKGGILTTMRSCLDATTADYFVPVDADDLLTDDALAILASTAGPDVGPDLVCSDEDVLDGDRFRDPFLRPDWDPVLHLASSYVWHALCIKRETALEVGLYDDPSFEWCHDWDTVERIRRAGGTIAHVPEVLYHWRRHTGSSTNSEAPETAQQDSVRAMFERMAADTGHPDRYEVAEFPLWRGATEFHLRRVHVDPAAVTLMSFGPLSTPARDAVAQSGAFPIQSIITGPPRSASSEELVSALEQLTTEFVVLMDPSAVLGGSDPLWEGLKWFELLDDVVAVCGRSVDDRGILVGGAELADTGVTDGSWSPLTGRPIGDPGPYALALKPHSIECLNTGFLIVDRQEYIAAMRRAGPNESIGESTVSVSQAIRDGGGRIIYDPLLINTRPTHLRAAPRSGSAPWSSRSGLGPIMGARSLFS